MAEVELWVPAGIAFTAIVDAYQRDRWIPPADARKWMTIDLYRRLNRGNIRARADEWHFDNARIAKDPSRLVELSGQGEMPPEWWGWAGYSETLLKRGHVDREGLRATNVQLEVSGHKFADAVRAAFAPAPAAKVHPFCDNERRTWIAAQPQMSADMAHKLFKAHPRFDGTKQDAFRREWKRERETSRGAPRKS